MKGNVACVIISAYQVDEQCRNNACELTKHLFPAGQYFFFLQGNTCTLTKSHHTLSEVKQVPDMD